MRARAGNLDLIGVVRPLLVHAVSEIDDDVVEHSRVDVLGQLREDEPIAELALPQDDSHVSLVVRLGAVAEQQEPGVVGGDGHEADQEVDAGPDDDGQEPKPQEDVDLLVDDVVGQDAETVLVLHRSGRTVHVERTLGHLGENLGQRIHPLLKGKLADGQDVSAVTGELAAEEHVHEINLKEDKRVIVISTSSGRTPGGWGDRLT